MTLLQREREIMEEGKEMGKEIGKVEGARMLQLRYAGRSYKEIADTIESNGKDVKEFLLQFE